jgi:hypothetical protein
MTRWIKHWQSLPPRNRAGAALCLAVLIVLVIHLVYQISDYVAGIRKAIHTPSPAAARSQVWRKTQPHLEQASHQATQALDKHLATIHAFLDEHKAGSKAFAERLLGLKGKWELVKAEIGDGNSYAAFLQEAFAEHVFPMEELEKAVATAVRNCLAEWESIDDDLLVRLRADLADDVMPRTVIPALGSDQALRSHYHELSQRVVQDLRTDLAVVAGRELFLWQASNVATDLTLQVGAAMAARLGFSSTLLTAGAASTWQTLGVGLVVAIVLDAVVNQIIKAAGYDAEEHLAQRVEETLTDLGRSITDGDPEARTTLAKLKAMNGDDPDEEVRAACAQAISSIEGGTRLYGLRRELTKIGAARASLRKETLRRLIQESEVTP